MRSFLAILLLSAFALAQGSTMSNPVQQPAATWPAATEGDYKIQNFKFRDGNTLPELSMHYYTIGTPKRDEHGHVTNAALFLHGTGGTGKQYLQANFAGQLFNPGQLLSADKYFLIMVDNIGHGKSSKPSDGLHMKFPS